MSSPKAAPRAAASNIAASLAALVSPARADASRRNGARSKGPKTAEGKARSAQNALKHGLRAQKHLVLPGESAAEFAALEAGLMEELAPEGALQTVLARRVVAASWRLERAERLEAEIFAHETYVMFGKAADLGLALIRDCNGAGAFDTLLRYRGGTLAELWRALRTLKALQAERREAREVAPDLPPSPCEPPIEPEPRTDPRQTMPPPRADGPRASARPDAAARHAEHVIPSEQPPEKPSEPEARSNPAATAAPAWPSARVTRAC